MEHVQSACYPGIPFNGRTHLSLAHIERFTCPVQSGQSSPVHSSPIRRRAAAGLTKPSDIWRTRRTDKRDWQSLNYSSVDWSRLGRAPATERKLRDSQVERGRRLIDRGTTERQRNQGVSGGAWAPPPTAAGSAARVIRATFDSSATRWAYVERPEKTVAWPQSRRLQLSPRRM